MPTCCDEIRHLFFSELSTTVPYDGRFGALPTVDIYYRDPETDELTLQGAGIFTEVLQEPGAIVVNHAEISSGIIKIH